MVVVVVVVMQRLQHHRHRHQLWKVVAQQQLLLQQLLLRRLSHWDPLVQVPQEHLEHPQGDPLLRIQQSQALLEVPQGPLVLGGRLGPLHHPVGLPGQGHPCSFLVLQLRPLPKQPRQVMRQLTRLPVMRRKSLQSAQAVQPPQSQRCPNLRNLGHPLAPLKAPPGHLQPLLLK